MLRSPECVQGAQGSGHAAQRADQRDRPAACGGPEDPGLARAADPGPRGLPSPVPAGEAVQGRPQRPGR